MGPNELMTATTFYINGEAYSPDDNTISLHYDLSEFKNCSAEGVINMLKETSSFTCEGTLSLGRIIAEAYYYSKRRSLHLALHSKKKRIRKKHMDRMFILI